MAIFEGSGPKDPRPASHGESIYQFLNRSEGEASGQIRGILNDWYSRFPTNSQADLRSRLRSNEDREFLAAFWELYLHETLARSGYTVECHPEVAGSSRSPDFLVMSTAGSFYLEAKRVSKSDESSSADNRKRALYDRLEGIDSPNFFLWVDLESEGASDLPTRKLRRDLEVWLRTLDPDEVSVALEQESSIKYELPFWEWRHDQWHVVFRAWPKSRTARGEAEIRPLGVLGGGDAYIVDDESPIKAALADKGGAYGRLEHPYIIALSLSSVTSDDFGITNVLYGTEGVRVQSDGSYLPTRQPNGYWRGSHGWAHERISAVLFAKSLSPWTVTKSIPYLWEHPAPTRSVTPVPPIWGQVRVISDQIVKTEPDKKIHQLLHLPEVWPSWSAV
jgi:hypothetical protein